MSINLDFNDIFDSIEKTKKKESDLTTCKDCDTNLFLKWNVSPRGLINKCIVLMCRILCKKMIHQYSLPEFIRSTVFLSIMKVLK